MFEIWKDKYFNTIRVYRISDLRIQENRSRNIDNLIDSMLSRIIK